METKYVLWIFLLASCLPRDGYAGAFIVSTPVNEANRENWKVNEEKTVEVEEKGRTNEWTIEKISEETRELGRGRNMFLSSETRCSRYCIERSVEENTDEFRYIDLFWSANGTNIMENFATKDYLRAPEVKLDDAGGSKRVLDDCQIYLDLNCDFLEIGSATDYIREGHYSTPQNNNNNNNNKNKFFKNPNSEIPRKLLEKYNLRGQTEVRFIVQNWTSRILINIDGSLSRATFQIPTNSTVWRSGLMISLVRTDDAEGVRIDTRNAPPGEWRLNLTGEENSKYHLHVDAFPPTETTNNLEDKLFLPATLTDFPEGSRGNLDGAPVMKYSAEMRRSSDFAILGDPERPADFSVDDTRETYEAKNLNVTEERSMDDTKDIFVDEVTDSRNESHKKPMNNSWASLPFTKLSTSEYLESRSILNDDGDTSISQSFANDEQNSKVTFPVKEHRNFHVRSSIASIEDVDGPDPEKSRSTSNDASMKLVEPLEDRELVEETAKYSEPVDRKRSLIDVNRNSNLLVAPGTIHRVVFDVSNTCVLPVRYTLRVKSSSFRIYNVQPTVTWVYPGQTNQVAVDVVIPNNIEPDTTNTVTLSVAGTEIKEKSVYLHTQGLLSKVTDDVKPTMEYWFNNNCAGKLDKDRCSKSRWSADVRIQDYDSGLKRVESTPGEIYPRMEFVSGTRSPVNFYYSATCCDTTVKVTAVDLVDNYHTLTIDVNVWDNLSGAEIATITLGALLVLLLIVLIILIIAYCVRRKKSHDLPYSQRYGSRPPARSERTSF